jgi:hypothetical protein
MERNERFRLQREEDVEEEEVSEDGDERETQPPEGGG